jgi:hypothetical protein
VAYVDNDHSKSSCSHERLDRSDCLKGHESGSAPQTV